MSDRLEAKFDKCQFIGYPMETYGSRKKVLVSKPVVFLKKEFLLSRDCGSNLELEEVQDAQAETYQLTRTEVVLHSDN